MVGFTVAACGGAAPPSPSPVANKTEAPVSVARDQVLQTAIHALVAGDVEGLMALADPKGLFDNAIGCNDHELGATARQLETKLRGDFTSAIDKAKGAEVEVVSIKNEARGWTHNSRHDRNATFVAKGGSVSSECTARTDLVFHEAAVRVRNGHGNDARESTVRFDLVAAQGHWYLLRVPKNLAVSADDPISKMEFFEKQMCDCKDKACADKVNEDMTRWGTEMARSASYDDERPDPDMAKRAADIMTKYTECMTKLMMAGAGNYGNGTP